MWILGISAFYHNSSCCLFKDDSLISALQEERLSRIKGDASFPVKAIRSVLDEQGLTIRDISLVCFYENPHLKIERQLAMATNVEQIAEIKKKLHLPESMIRKNLSYTGEIYYSEHHLSHVGNGVFQSGWESAKFLCADSVGEKKCLSWGEYSSNSIQVQGHIDFPHSLGILYSTLASFLHFSVNDEEYKMMGLAAHGTPAYKSLIRENLLLGHGKNFSLNETYFNLGQTDGPMYSEKLGRLLGFDPRKRNEPFLQIHKDLASSVQSLLEDETIQLIKDVFPNKIDRLIFCGGVAHNSLLNQKLTELSGIDHVFIPAAPNDVGSSIGSCIIGKFMKEKRFLLQKERAVPYWATGVTKASQFGDLSSSFQPLSVEEIVKNLRSGKVVAICRGVMEFGDRALGNRSILGDPDFPGIKDIINLKIKKREDFRPFAPIVVAEKASEYFVMDEENKLMSKTYPLKTQLSNRFKGIQNIDGTARVQTLVSNDNEFLHSLLLKFGSVSGYPMLINTSLNLNGEPIALDEAQALDIFLRSEIDILILEETMIFKSDVPADFLANYRSSVFPVPGEGFKSSYDFL